MSIKSFIQKIVAAIKRLFTNLPEKFKDAVHVGVIVTENFKIILDSPVADFLTALIPGELDDRLKAALRVALPDIVLKLRMVEASLGFTDPDDIMAAALQAFMKLTGDDRSEFLHNLSIRIAQVAADGELTWSDAVYLLQWYYENRYKPEFKAAA